MLKVYLARGMSGRIKEDVVEEARKDKEFLEKAGFKVLCPVTEEKVKAENKILQSTYAHMVKYWARDKQMINEADIIIDCTAHLNSEGVKHEVLYARYHLWKPVIRIFPAGQLPPRSSIAQFEDDAIVDSLLEAIEWMLRVYGTPYKRLKWKLNILDRCILKYIQVRLRWFIDWI